YYGKLRVRPMRLVAALLLPGLVLAGIAWAARTAYGRVSASSIHRTFTLAPEAIRGVTVTVFRSADEYLQRYGTGAADGSRGSTIARIQRTGVLRVGYNPSIVPFCYWNDAGQLVGYDVAEAYDLARSLNVRLVFGPFEWKSLAEDLIAERFDIAMAG